MKNLILTLLLALLAGSGLIQAQSAIPADDVPAAIKKKPPVIILNSDQLELVREYLDVLEQIDRLTTDYSKYLGGYQAKAAGEYLKAIREFRKEMAASEYLISIEHLKIGVAELKEQMQAQKERLETGEERKAYKLAWALSKELESLDDLIELELTEHLAKAGKDIEKINEYLEFRIERSLNEVRHGRLNFEYDFPTTIVLDTALVGGEIIVVSIPTALVAPELAYINVPIPSLPPKLGVVPVAPVAPLPPTVRVTDRDIIFENYDGRTSLIRTFEDSSAELSSLTPIQIHNPIGNLEVTGWDNDYVRVTLKLKVLADDQTKVRKFARKLNLNIYFQNDVLFVSPEVPSLSDPSTQIASNDVEVSVPYGNPIVCQSSFGEIVFQKLDNDVKISSDNSSIFISEVDGQIIAANSNGPVTAEDCIGSLNIKNSMGAINIADCEGVIELHNSYSVTRLKRCVADVMLKGEGQIDISDHEGKIEINNRNGQVRVVRSEGDIFITNTHGPSIVALIEGSATIENINAGIHAENISGEFSARNSHAPIVVSGIGGPLSLSNDYGDISLVLSEIIRGTSIVESVNGRINIRLVEDQDMIFNVYSIGGDIKTSLPFVISESGADKKLEHVFGTGDNKLSVNSKSGTVLITED